MMAGQKYGGSNLYINGRANYNGDCWSNGKCGFNQSLALFCHSLQLGAALFLDLDRAAVI